MNKKREFLTAAGKWDKRFKYARIFTRHQDYPRALERWRKIMNDETLREGRCWVELHD